jgi:hypothetical protein
MQIWIVSGSRAAQPKIDNQSPPNYSPRVVCTLTGSQANGMYKRQLWKDLENFANEWKRITVFDRHVV